MESDVRRAIELALSTLSERERQSAAAYIDTRELDSRARMTIGRVETEIPARGYLVFVDPSPTANWGHPCRYLLIETATGTIHRFDAQFPPFLRDVSPTLRLIWKGQQVPVAVLPVTEGVE
ncbi:MAG TPA: hypothetical protein VLT62_17020 [Candidatus Methylomirabilis sp.]|nr:hypothetical protein [Candidatus Methylomirabilis sp.]